jgi:hypothetical protein
MACILIVLVGLFAFPVSRGVHRELEKTGYAFSTVIAVVVFIALFIVAGLIFLSKFRFVR